MKPAARIPESHRDLLARPIPAVLATMGPAGFPRARPAWCESDGDGVLVLSAESSVEAGDVAARPVATVLVVDPDDTSRWIEVRGDAGVSAEGAAELADRLDRLHSANGRCGGVESTTGRGEKPLMILIRPTRVNLDAIHR